MRKQRGQTLLETLLALSASVFILSAITVVVINSLSSTTFTKNQNLANQYAQEGIEVVRRIRDSNWGNFSGHSDTHYCLPQSQTSLTVRIPPNCIDEGEVGIFIRAVDIEHDNSDCPDNVNPADGSKVTSKVLWSDGKCPVGNPYCHKVELISCFYNINSIPTP